VINTAIVDTPCAPQCEPYCTPEEGCEVCWVYVCQGCGERKPWDNGGTDSEECDECWLSTERKKARALDP
jgi:hypothetical protein